MAITNAQQYQQLVNKPAGNKRPGYAGRDRDYQQRGQSKQSYSTSRQQQNFSARDNSPTRSRIQEDRQKDFEQNPDRYKTNVRGDGEGSNILSIINPFSKERRKLSYNASMLIPGQKERSAKMQRARINYLKSLGLPIPEELEEELPSANFFVGPASDRTSPSYKDPMTDEVKRVKTYGEQIAEEFGAPGVMMSGNVGGLEKFVKTRDADGKPLTYGYTEKRGDGDGMSDYERRLLALEQSMSPTTEPEVDPNSLQAAIANRGIAYRFMADGGMTNDAPVEGGIMDLESGRQMYFLGKLVKKATRAIKKIVKSPIGKLGLGALAFGGATGGFGASDFLRKTLLPKLYSGGKMTGLG